MTQVLLLPGKPESGSREASGPLTMSYEALNNGRKVSHLQPCAFGIQGTMLEEVLDMFANGEPQKASIVAGSQEVQTELGRLMPCNS